MNRIVAGHERNLRHQISHADGRHAGADATRAAAGFQNNFAGVASAEARGFAHEQARLTVAVIQFDPGEIHGVRCPEIDPVREFDLRTGISVRRSQITPIQRQRPVALRLALRNVEPGGRIAALVLPRVDETGGRAAADERAVRIRKRFRRDHDRIGLDQHAKE